MTDTSPTIRDRSLATLSPVLGRYFQRPGSVARATASSTATAASYLDFANGIAVTSLGHAHPRVNAAIHAQVDQLLHVCNGLGLPGAGDAPGGDDRRGDARRPGHGLLRQLRRGGRRRRRQAGASRHRPQPLSSPSAGAFHGRTYGAVSVTTSSLNYRTGYDPLAAGRPHRAVPERLPRLRRRRGGASALRPGPPASGLFATQRAAVAHGAAFIIEPVQGEGGYVPAPGFVPAGTARAGGPARHPAHHRRGPVGLRPHRARCGPSSTPGIVPDVVLVAKAHRQRHATGGHRVLAATSSSAGAWAPTAPRTVATRSPARPASRSWRSSASEGLVANAAARGAELTRGLQALAAEDPRIGDVRGPGLMIGVELVKDRGHARAGRRSARRSSAACADAGLLLLTCGPSHNIMRWIPPLDVSRGRGRGEPGHLPGGTARDPLSRATR